MTNWYMIKGEDRKASEEENGYEASWHYVFVIVWLWPVFSG